MTALISKNKGLMALSSIFIVSMMFFGLSCVAIDVEDSDAAADCPILSWYSDGVQIDWSREYNDYVTIRSADDLVKDGYVFAGWDIRAYYTDLSRGIFQPGDSVLHNTIFDGEWNANAIAVWVEGTPAVITLSGTPASTDAVVGSSWSFTPTSDVDDCTLSVSGANWLTVNNGTIIGTPTTAGTYNITLTASKTGYEDGTMTFSVTVYSALSFSSLPTTGVIAYAY